MRPDAQHILIDNNLRNGGVRPIVRNFLNWLKDDLQFYHARQVAELSSVNK